MLPEDQLTALQQRILSYAAAPCLPQEDVLLDLADRAVGALEAEDASYRPVAKDGKPGGLLDFCGEQVPVIIVPDLHARPAFLANLLQSPLAGFPSVLQALNEGRVMVVCVGDCFHSETMGAAYARWKQSFDAWRSGVVDSPGMQAEMGESLAALFAVMELKLAFPRHFHFLKGNHENILNADGGGDHAFRKFALEGQMVKDFMYARYSDASLHVISCFERRLPIVAVFGTFAVSHAEPATAFRRRDIINYHEGAQVILAFTWTANDEAEPGSVRKMFHELNPHADKDRALWFGGHRPVPDTYLLRQQGAFIQIHNPDKMNVAVVTDAAAFDPERDIVPVTEL